MIAGQIYTWVEVQDEIKKALANGGGGNASWNTIEDKPAVIAAGTTQAEARTVIGAGTSNLAVGTGANDAKAGNYQPTWAQVTGKPTVIASGGDAAAARASIGAGTGNSNLALGTTAATALKGDSFKGGLLTVEQITQAAYDALGAKVATTLYVIVG